MKLTVKEYLLLYIYINQPCRVGDIRFWGITLFVIRATGLEIDFDGHILTIKDCFTEIEDIFKNSELKFEGNVK